VTPGSPVGQKANARPTVSTCSKGKGQAGASPLRAHPGGLPTPTPGTLLQCPAERQAVGSRHPAGFRPAPAGGPSPGTWGHGSPPGAAGCARTPGWQRCRVNPASPPSCAASPSAPAWAVLPQLKKPLMSPATRRSGLSQGSLQSRFGERGAARR